MLRTVSVRQAFAIALASTLAGWAAPKSSAAPIVINEGYGGGGNSGSTYTNDFVELYNNGPTAVDISGYQVDYSSAAGTATLTAFGTDDTFSSVVPSGTTLPSHGFYLIQEAKGSAGTTALPSPNLTDATPIAMGATGFRLYLFDSTGAQADEVGASSSATVFEGAGPAPAPSNTNSVQRLVDGVDTNNNNVDFGVGTPTPGTTNVATAVPEPASLGVLVAGIGLMGFRRRRSRAR